MMTILVAVALTADAPALRPGLGPLGFLVGHCWRGEFPTGERDVHCFDTVYGGQHVRDRHEVTGRDDPYRGETLYSADAAGSVSYTYWNSLGGVSRGSMRPDGSRLDFGDERYRGPDGREMSISTHWRRIGDDAYEAVSASPADPSMNRTVRYQRIEEPVSVNQSRGADESHVLVHETIVDAPVTEVWTAIATADGWRSWAVPLAWDSPVEAETIEASYVAGATPGDASTIRQRILVQVPGRLLAFRTVKGPEGFPHFDVYRRTTSLFELEPDGERRTRVRLTGAGYPDSEAGRQLLGYFRGSNRLSLERLRQRFLSGPTDWSREAPASRADGE